MSTNERIAQCIEAAADAVGSVWPLHSFVTANPLEGFEDQPFHEAIEDTVQLLGGDGYPSVDVFRTALERGQIDREILRDELSAHGYVNDPETSLVRMADGETETDTPTTATEQVDAVVTKWLAAFLDQGTAAWPMPNRADGFYDAFRDVARYDSQIPDTAAVASLPGDPTETIRACLAAYPADEWQDIFEFQLSALPGWTGFLKQHAASTSDWQSEYPITLSGYLAIRLALADQFDAPMSPAERPESPDHSPIGTGEVPLPEIWLTAWESTYRKRLVDSIATERRATDGGRPDAQFVFCIDTRSEIIRRHIEATGNYETHGYAGFFGIPMRYDDYESEVTVDSHPPLLDPEHRIADRPTSYTDSDRDMHHRWHATLGAGKTAIKHIRGNAATVFSFVETAGVGYGAALTARTLVPTRVRDLLDSIDDRVPDEHEFCELTVDYNPDAVYELREGLTLEEKVAYAHTAFDLMGWEQFARVVVFAGHASETANNPFDSSLDCGACAGNPGGPNARVLAAICNDEAVRTELRDRGIEIPDDTVFVAGEHNTTTDEIELYTDAVPESHADDIAQLRSDLDSARRGATAERTEDMGADTDSPVRETERRANDWAETRPEWGLAGNAGFVIGPRRLTDGLDLDGRVFLHSYDWDTDPDGDALESIIAGPMVVTQWINTQYYFATVDTAAYGSGSKITHNPVGNVGVYQGNGGDLMTGLPIQSLMHADETPYHQPLRLSTIIHAPRERVTSILAEHEAVTELLDNDWLSLTVVDPQRDNRAFLYERDLNWTPLADSAGAEPKPETAPRATDD